MGCGWMGFGVDTGWLMLYRLDDLYRGLESVEGKVDFGLEHVARKSGGICD